MNKPIILASALFLAYGLAPTVQASTSEVVLPGAMSSDPGPLETWSASYFMGKLGLGDVLSFIDGRNGHRIAHFPVPADDKAFEVPNYKVKFFAPQLSKITGRFAELQASGTRDIDGKLDMLRVVRSLEDRQAESTSDHHIMIVGSPVQATTATAFSMRSEGSQLLLPSDRHIKSPLRETPYGMTSKGRTLDGLTFHFCVTDRAARTVLEDRLLMRFWNHLLAERGAALATWTDDISVCVEHFERRHTKRIKVATLDEDQPLGMALFGPADRNKSEIETTEPFKAGPDVFNLFSKAHHPSIEGLLVFTGVEYNPDDYPVRYVHAWCYAHIVNNDGAQVRLNIGSKSPSKDPVWDDPTDRNLRTSGVSRVDFDRSSEACQFPEN